MGRNVITCAQRQPSGTTGTTKRPMSAAPTKPKEKKPARAPMNHPRRWLGTNSARNGEMIALSAPVPAPAMMRAIRNTSKLQEAAATSEAMAYNAKAYIITFLRPILSPRYPAQNAPNRNPKGDAEATKPSWLLLRWKTSPTSGIRKATTAASMPSKV